MKNSSRVIKFRAWDKKDKYWVYSDHTKGLGWFFNLLESKHCNNSEKDYLEIPRDIHFDFELMQYTGLNDKNGKEIYEFMELDGRWEVDWLNGKYILCDISTGDIINLDYENKYEITREYTKI